jgi:hypothetical protein
MKKLLLLLLFFTAKNITSQNGWATYSGSIPSGTIAIPQETTIFIDNAGNKWVGFTGGGSMSSLIFAVYTNSTSTWNYWNRSTMGISTLTLGGFVKDFAQDNLGNIWIGTGSGLIKYNGFSFIVFTTADGLPHNNIYCLEYNNNMLYIGTHNGISRYDGTTFTNYTIANSLLPVSLITDIKAENTNTLWATSGNKLVKFYINSSFTSTSYTLSATTNTGVTLNKIHIDALGIKWFVNSNGILKYDNINFTYFENMYPDYTGTYSLDGKTILKGPNNGILTTGVFMSTSGGKRCLVEFLPGSTTKFYYSPPSISIEYSIEADATGKHWITGAVSGPTSALTAKIHKFDFSLFSTLPSYGWGPGINNDNYKFIDINRVKAGIMNRGDMWWDAGGSGNPSYEVPKTGLSASSGTGVHSAFGGAIWMGGLDAANQLHVAAQTFRQEGNDFWPGPLDTTNASIDTAVVVNYDKIWKVDFNEINTFITQYNLGNVPYTYTPTPDILSWPAKGTGNKSRNLAPFVDVNNNGIYDPMVGGDYPKIKGDQTLYFIFNDAFGPHTQSGGLPLGVEVHAMVYAYGCTKVLNGRSELAYTTFYDYKVFNRSSNNYHDMYIGLWSDVDLGAYIDDYIGSSVQNNVGFAYNADPLDQNGPGSNGYNNYPPAVGTAILKGPTANVNDGIDNDHDSIIDEIGEQCLLSVFDYYNNNIGFFPTSVTGPSNKYHYYNFLTAKWKDSTNFTCGGNAYGGTIPTKHVYPWTNFLGNPCSKHWDEISAGNYAGDRRYIVSSGPFDFPAHGMTEIEYAQVWSVDSSATSNIHLASVNKLISDVQKIRSFYKGTIPSCLSSVIGMAEDKSEPSILIYPNPSNSFVYLSSEQRMDNAKIRIYDVLGKTVLEKNSSDNYETSIDISSINPGFYFISIKFDNNASAIKKFVKQ